VEAVSNKPIPGVEHQIESLALPAVADFALKTGFNCCVLGDDVSTIALASLGVVACGRADMLPWLSGDDSENFHGLTILRPVRQCLAEEAKFYCEFHGLEFASEALPCQKAFRHEQVMLDAIMRDGHGGTPFAIQKFGERLPVMNMHSKCNVCGLPAMSEGACDVCKVIYGF
jgi:hypothetical protein